MARSPYNIEPDASFLAGGRHAIMEQVDTLFANLAGTREGVDVEALHDMRVASRRLRAALSVFGPAFPPKKMGPIEREVARVTDALGAVRDDDVQLEYMESISSQAAENERVGLEAFIADLRKQRDRDRVALVKEMDRLEKSKLRAAFEELFAEQGVGGEDSHG